ncbi:Inner membrane transport protein YajR [Pseudomonas chlororaphis subsp. aurantiaca]|uniref:MFS transporter n=1 Tax=Pseudomonas chlororaphis subsp. aurantiaca TaxID=86192 RepID=A0AAJ0ZPU8_9PSED|nr:MULTISPECIES: MFS transporter [Pseudomonas]AIS10782.1 MFS transporter [Pseudomonas chlororaphis subsp. aurantiaca]AZD24801.1 Inner membrane transport protein YajR [Pseudomonas chlororaphis subsp. aurantiaca]AZD38449.1 Inner membrane transport protein YajR [Pseudomonas chlororaphis subsp. aurantiaca]AZD44790.1 Inner membrane transport protein YajR [Pseudomonas chlororaphis subsp. aurantiaca]AZD51088.1 Inner membrane transport protein YajR [Pseudomonas chlororaphis subsp. aurantiaca]
MHDPHSERMSGAETRAASGLALVFAFRMLGMFMVLPVLATYGMDLAGATPALIGLAIGAYGLTQAIFQIPFGIISDRIGRRPVIYLGLIVFALGSVLAANADSIWGVIAGRILQGAGAISAAVMALLSDLTREQHRTKAMAMIGMTIGLSFAVAMVVGPLLTRSFGLSGLFFATGGMALLGIFIVAFMVPRSTGPLQHRESGVARQALLPTLKHPDLLRLDLGIFVLHAMLMSSFVALPLALVEKAGLPKEQHWWVYLTALLISFFAMIPFIIYGEKKRKMKRVLLGAVSTLLLTELFFWEFGDSLQALVIGTVVFFTAFNLLEASLPSLISKVSPAGGKGTAMGVYSTSQFLGSALGGILGGWLFQHGGLSVVFLGCAGLAALWLAFAVTMREPPYVTSLRLPLSPEAIREAGLVERLKAVVGVTDAVMVAEEAAIYIKLDTELLDRATLEQLVNPARSACEA